MIILSVNAGSSSLKFTGFKMPEEEVIVSGLFERIGIAGSCYTIKLNGEKIKKERDLPNHEEAVKILIDELLLNGVIKSLDEIEGVGHRLVHGGEKYANSVIIDDDVISTVTELIPLAPLHNPANLIGVETFKKLLPNVLNVAVFDTAFHQTMDKSAYIYPVPYEWYSEYGVRKYGFHGTSHKYINDKISEILNRKDLKVISCHLGNGGSITAIDSGRVVDTTMGFTPNAGLVMGTRSGDIDASFIPYVISKSKKSLDEVISDLNKKSGLLGISGVSSDSRDIEAGVNEGDVRCVLAEEIYENKIVSYIASYYCLLGGADVICFAGGVGENGITVRRNIINKLAPLGVKLDADANNVRGVVTKISSDESKVLCYLIPTDEELMIARDTYNLICGK
ncbi:MAG: acetate/propionate family kinase [Bacilli bacterium]